MLFQSIPALFWCPILGGMTLVFPPTVSSLQSILVLIHLHCDGLHMYTPCLLANQTMRTPSARSAMESASNHYQDFFIDFQLHQDQATNDLYFHLKINNIVLL